MLYNVCLSAFKCFWKTAISEVQRMLKKPGWSSCKASSLCIPHSSFVWYCHGLVIGSAKAKGNVVDSYSKSFIYLCLVYCGVYTGNCEMEFIKGNICPPDHRFSECFSVRSAASSSEITGRL